MKINNLAKIESGGQKGGALTQVPLDLSTDPNKKRHTLHV